jgi:hypothetical protein
MILTVLRTLWTLPTTAVGLSIGVPCMVLGTRVQMHTGVLEFHGGLAAWLLEHATLLEGGALAITFGDVVIARSTAAHDLTREHERVHVRQCHRWGPFFIPAYLLASAVIWVGRGDPYRGNPFEKEAYAMSDARRR